MVDWSLVPNRLTESGKNFENKEQNRFWSGKRPNLFWKSDGQKFCGAFYFCTKEIAMKHGTHGHVTWLY